MGAREFVPYKHQVWVQPAQQFSNAVSQLIAHLTEELPAQKIPIVVAPNQIPDIQVFDGGYLRLWIPESDNALRLARLRELIRNRQELRRLFDEIFDREMAANG